MKTRTKFQARVAKDTPQKIKEIAQSLSITYGGEGWSGGLLDAIASGKVILILASKDQKSG